MDGQTDILTTAKTASCKASRDKNRTGISRRTLIVESADNINFNMLLFSFIVVILIYI